jgi:hypothetical protein
MSRYNLSDEVPAQSDFGVFRRFVELECGRHRNWREGQTAFNLLYILRPDLSEQIRGDVQLDPFYVDGKLPAFWAWVEQEWGE